MWSSVLASEGVASASSVKGHPNSSNINQHRTILNIAQLFHSNHVVCMLFCTCCVCPYAEPHWILPQQLQPSPAVSASILQAMSFHDAKACSSASTSPIPFQCSHLLAPPLPGTVATYRPVFADATTSSVLASEGVSSASSLERAPKFNQHQSTSNHRENYTLLPVTCTIHATSPMGNISPWFACPAPKASLDPSSAAPAKSCSKCIRSASHSIMLRHSSLIWLQL